MFVLCLVSCLVSAAWGLGVLAGLGYCVAGALAPLYVRRQALLQVVLAPPATFLVAVVIAQAITAQGDSAHGTILSVLEGTFLMLAGAAPWLLVGTATAVGVAMYRGLPHCIRDFRAALRGEAVAGRPPRVD
jgi:biotin transporter BioY